MHQHVRKKKQNFCILFTFCGFWSVFRPSPWKCLRRAQTNFSHGSVMYHTHEVISSYFCLPRRHRTPPRRPAWLTASSSLLDFASPYWNICVQWWSKKRSILENWRKRWHRELLIWVLSTGWETTISVCKIFLFYFASVQKEKKKDMWRCQRESSWCSLYCKHHLYLYSECNINLG